MKKTPEKKLVIKTITPTKEKKEIKRVFPKMEVLNNVPVPAGHIRVIVLVDHRGMLDDLYAGDIIDVPERRFKSMRFRGLVKEYNGGSAPTKQR